MRILFVSPEVPGPDGAGIATYLTEATRALSARGHECHVMTWTDAVSLPRTSSYPAYDLHEYPTPEATADGLDDGLILSSAIADWVLALHKIQRFDLIEGTDWEGPLYCLLQRRNVERALDDCCITVFNHGSTYNIARHDGTFTPRSRFQKINLEHQCLALADVVICPSQAARQNLQEVHDVASERIRVIPEPLETLRRLGTPPEAERTLLFYGSICVYKGLREFLSVAKRMRAIGGVGPIEFIGPIRGPAGSAERLTAEIVTLLGPPAGQVTFTGPLRRDDALSRVGAHHVLVNMSKPETYCYAFLECIRRGAMPVALAGSAQAEFIPEHLRATFTVGPTPTDIEAFSFDKAFEAWRTCAEEVQQYAAALSSPAGYCDAYERLVGSFKRKARPSIGKWANAPVSVLIPAYEPDETLLETVASALAQDVAPAEILIGNDGSRSPSALAILDRAAKYDKVRRIDFTWRGLAETRNRLLAECKTPLFAFVDADDVLNPNFISTSREFLSANYDESVHSVQGWYELFGTQTGRRGPVIYQHFSHALWNDLKNNMLGVTETFRKLGYNSALHSGEAEDWEFWLRYFRQGLQVRIVPQVLWRYRRHSGALSSRWSESMSVGTARANAKVLGSCAAGSIPAHVWEFIGEYMYLGESFSHPNQERYFLRKPCKDQRKIEARLSSFHRRGARHTFRQRAVLRVMRHLSKSLR